MSTDWSPVDPIAELRFALAEPDSQPPGRDFRHRLLGRAMSERKPGLPLHPAEHITGLETMRRLATRLTHLLNDLGAMNWAKATVRDLDVQQLVGHLIGVELAFAATLRGDAWAADADHVASTQPSALRQSARPPSDTIQEWTSAVADTIAYVEAEMDPATLIRFHGFALDLDSFLVARSFELWTHEEDIRRATGRELVDPDAETLSRMTALATALLPAGIALADPDRGDVRARLVLSGPGGGTWDVPLQGRAVVRAKPGQHCDSHVVVDAAAFCRVAANRADLARSGAIVSCGISVAETLFAGAAALALD
jgi:uncharacterized protein (TIGR03083 family)